MGVTFQAFAVDTTVLDGFRADRGAAEEYCRERYGDDVAHESVWLDKSGIGIMEAFGVMSGEAAPPASWVFGDDQMDIGDYACPFLTSVQVAEVSTWMGGITEDEFRTLAGFNEVDTDVDYLAGFFVRLRDFYLQAATDGKATFTYVSY